MKPKKAPPYDFVLERLGDSAPFALSTRAMFGCTAVYADEKIVLILREKETETQDNGIWIATTRDHHESLKKEFPSMRSIEIFAGDGPTGWQNLPADADDFEAAAERVCRLILRGDPRVGKIPERAKKKINAKKLKSKKPDTGTLKKSQIAQKLHQTLNRRRPGKGQIQTGRGKHGGP